MWCSTVKPQRLEHWWLVYNGQFELIFESQIVLMAKKNQTNFYGYFRDFLYFITNKCCVLLLLGVLLCMLCVLIRVTSSRRFLWVHTTYIEIEKTSLNKFYLSPHLALWLSLTGSNYPCLDKKSHGPKDFRSIEIRLYKVTILALNTIDNQLLLTQNCDHNTRHNQINTAIRQRTGSNIKQKSLRAATRTDKECTIPDSLL